MNIRTVLSGLILVFLLVPGAGYALPSGQNTGFSVLTHSFSYPSGREIGSLLGGNYTVSHLSWDVHSYSSVERPAPESGLNFDEQLFDLLVMLFVGSILIGLAGIIRRNRTSSPRIWKSPSGLKVRHSYKEALSAETY